MSIWPLICQQSVFKRYHSGKRFSEFLHTRWQQKSTGKITSLSRYVYGASHSVARAKTASVRQRAVPIERARSVVSSHSHWNMHCGVGWWRALESSASTPLHRQPAQHSARPPPPPPPPKTINSPVDRHRCADGSRSVLDPSSRRSVPERREVKR